MEQQLQCLDDFQAPKSVWAELKAKLVPAEVQEVVRILGQSQIDRNEGLHQELGTLLEILREYTAEVDGKVQQWRSRFARDTKRDMITTEIRSFVSALRSKTSTPISLRPATPHDRSVLYYVLPEQDPLLVAPSARQLLASRGSSSCGARGGMALSVGQCERPSTAVVAGCLAREIAAREGGDVGGGMLSLDAMETEAQRFQQVLREEEEELKEHIEFLQAVIDAEHERAGLHSAVPTTSDLTELRDKLQTELSFANAEDRINKSKSMGGGPRLTPLVPLGHNISANVHGSSLSGSRSRGATPLCSEPLPAFPPSRAGLGNALEDSRPFLHSASSSRLDSSRALLASASSGGGGSPPGSGGYVDGVSSRPFSRCAAELGLDLDSDEDDFLFGGADRPAHSLSSISARNRNVDVLVLDDDADDEQERAKGKQERVDKKKEKKRSSASASGGAGCVPVVDEELQEQSKAIRDLLSGLVTRDTLANLLPISPDAKALRVAQSGRDLESDDPSASAVDGSASAVDGLDTHAAHMRAHACGASAGASHAELARGGPRAGSERGVAAEGFGTGARRVSLGGRHRSLIQQARNTTCNTGQGGGGGNQLALAAAHSAPAPAPAPAPLLPLTTAAPLTDALSPKKTKAPTVGDVAVDHSFGVPGVAGAAPQTPSIGALGTLGALRAAVRVTPASSSASSSAGEAAGISVRGPSRGVGAVAAGAVAAGAGLVRPRGDFGVSGVAFTSFTAGSPPTPPAVPRIRSAGASASTGERLRAIYTRPTASISSRTET